MGYYYVKKRNETTWHLMHKTGSKAAKLPDKAVEALGFDLHWSIEDARARAIQINKQNKLALPKAAKHALEVKAVESAFLPEKEVVAFYEDVLVKTWSKDSENKKQRFIWRTTQRMLAELRLDPKDFSSKSDLIFKWFLKQQYSPSYATKLLQFVNLWGEWVCHRRGQVYTKVLQPTGVVRARLTEMSRERATYHGPSKPLAPEELEAKRDKLKVTGNYEWLYLTVWFGLRPQEVELLRNPEFHSIEEHTKPDGTQTRVLCVYQSKLVTIEPDQRWKRVPCLYPEQLKALDYVRSGAFKRPSRKTLRSVFGEGFHLYAGRKNFEGMMSKRGHSLETIASWMGHQNIQTTWSKYRNRAQVRY